MQSPGHAVLRSPALAQVIRSSMAPDSMPGSPATSVSSDEYDDLRDGMPLELSGPPAAGGTAHTYADLPHEILLHIFRYLLGSQADLQACLLVCKRWCVCGVQVLWHRPSFYKLSALFKLIHVMIQPDASFPYASYVRRLNFSTLAGDLDDQLFGRMAACHRLERLTLAGCSQVTDATLARVLRNTPQLVAVDLSGVVQLTDATLEVLAATCTRLQGANLSGCRQIRTHGVLALANACPSLRRVKLGGCELVDGSALRTLLRACPILLEADFVGCPLVDDASVREAWLRPSILRELKLAHCSGLTDRAFPTPALRAELELARGADTLSSAPPLFALCEPLRILDLTGCAHITDETVRGIVTQAPRLRNLALAKCSRLTDQSVYAIAALGRNLQYLHLAHIPRYAAPRPR